MNNFLDNSLIKGRHIVEILEEYKLSKGDYPIKLEEIMQDNIKTSIDTEYLYIDQGSFYFLQFDWTGQYVGYFDYNEKRWLLREISKKNPSRIIKYDLRTW